MSCAYCQVCDESSVVQCLGCERWFCNGSANTPGSHIVNHLVRSRHKCVALHESSPLGDSILECFNCGSKNVFLLGFIPSKQDNVVVLLCREPCLVSNQVGSLKDSPNWDLSLWQPLIEERAFVPWLVKVPELDEEECYAPLSSAQIAQLEELWRKDPKATLDQVVVEAPSVVMEPVPLRFEDAFHYQRVFSPLVKLEAECDKRLKESQSSQNVSVRWELSVTKRRICYFMFTREDHEKKLAPGDELRISIENFEPVSNQVLITPTMGTVTWEATGYVTKVLPSEEICLELKPQFVKGPWETNRGFRVSFVWKSTSFDRQQMALKSFATDDTSLSGIVYRMLLGQASSDLLLKVVFPSSFHVPGLPRLNPSQIYAIRKALAAPVCTLQGPPGTGKTVTASALIYHLSKQPNAGQILVCAPSNIACDHLTEKLDLTGLKVVRVTAKSRQDIVSSVDRLTLHAQVKQLIGEKPAGELGELAKLMTLRDTVGELSFLDDRRFRSLLTRLEARILAAADVVCTTCVCAADVRISRLRFKHVLIDEATQATEPEILIPMVLGSKQVILVGDHCQLGPVILDKAALKSGFNTTMFQRLLQLGMRPLRLEVQYRMHPALSEFPSQTFYEGALQNGVTLADRTLALSAFPWVRADMPLLFYHSGGTEEISGSGTSYLNRGEALNIERLVTQLIKSGLRANQIGVITPYEGQRAHIQSVLQRHTSLQASVYRDIEIASVDAFQGREKDFVILSCVRSNAHAGLGFLHDPRRLNVALTRARYGLVVCGNAVAISRAPGRNGVPSVWSGFISHLQKHALIVEGPLGALRQIQFNLGRISNQRHEEQKWSVPVDTSATVESAVTARTSYFEENKKSSSSRRRTHSVDSDVSAVSYQSQQVPPR